MDRDEALGLIALRLLNAGARCQQDAPGHAEELFDTYVAIRRIGSQAINVPAEFVADALSTL